MGALRTEWSNAKNKQKAYIAEAKLVFKDDLGPDLDALEKLQSDSKNLDKNKQKIAELSKKCHATAGKYIRTIHDVKIGQAGPKEELVKVLNKIQNKCHG